MRVLGDLESEIMEIIWQQQVPMHVRDVMERLQKERKIAYTTVMTIMGRLVKKSLLTRKLQGIGYLYETRVTRDKFIANTVHNIFTSTVSALGEASAAYFIKEIQRLHPKKRQELVKILDGKKKIQK